MSFIERMLKQEVSYWAPSTIDKFGDRTFATPTHLQARYENKTVTFLTAKGDESQTRAVVYLLDAVAADGYIYNGYSEAASPLTVTGSDQIRRVDSCQDIKANSTFFKAYL